MKHKVGDIVMIREWDDMASEFGINGGRDINTPKCIFSKYMAKYCGAFGKIAKEFNGKYEIENFGGWNFTDAMFTDWEPKKEADDGIPSIADSGDRTVFPTGAVRDMHAGKGRMDLLPFYAILELSKLCESGAIKYGEHNADKGIPQHSLIDSAMRHLFKYAAGYTDEDHLLAAFWNLGRAVNQRTTHPELIDVPWKG